MHNSLIFIFLFSCKGSHPKNGYFRVRLTVRLEATPPYDQLFVFILVCPKTSVSWSKNKCFLVQKHCFQPFLVGQNFHICLLSGQRGLTHPPTPLRSA